MIALLYREDNSVWSEGQQWKLVGIVHNVIDIWYIYKKKDYLKQETGRPDRRSFKETAVSRTRRISITLWNADGIPHTSRGRTRNVWTDIRRSPKWHRLFTMFLLQDAVRWSLSSATNKGNICYLLTLFPSWTSSNMLTAPVQSINNMLVWI